MQRFVCQRLRRWSVWVFTMYVGINAFCGIASGQSLSKQLLAEGATSLAQAARERGDSVRGAILFPQKKLNCALCHAQGATDLLGPDLTLIGKDVDDEHFVESILQPSKVIQKGFESIQALTVDGRVQTGMIQNESANSITLRRPDNQNITLLRVDIEEMRSTGLSFMPEGLEKELDHQAMADLLAYLRSIE